MAAGAGRATDQHGRWIGTRMSPVYAGCLSVRMVYRTRVLGIPALHVRVRRVLKQQEHLMTGRLFTECLIFPVSWMVETTSPIANTATSRGALLVSTAADGLHDSEKACMSHSLKKQRQIILVYNIPPHQAVTKEEFPALLLHRLLCSLRTVQ